LGFPFHPEGRRFVENGGWISKSTLSVHWSPNPTPTRPRLATSGSPPCTATCSCTCYMKTILHTLTPDVYTPVPAPRGSRNVGSGSFTSQPFILSRQVRRWWQAPTMSSCTVSSFSADPPSATATAHMIAVYTPFFHCSYPFRTSPTPFPAHPVNITRLSWLGGCRARDESP